MKDEIKEILDDLRKTADNTIFVVCSSQEELDKTPRYTANFTSINDRKAKLLLDYITNLQEELKSANESITWWQNRFNALQEENKKLKEDNYGLIKYINEEEGFVKDENRELGLRIDKAVEYIVNNCDFQKIIISDGDNDKIIKLKELLEILEDDKD